MIKGVRLADSERARLAAEVVKKYEQRGMSIRQLATETGRSYGAVHQMLTQAGVTLRGRGGARLGKARRVAGKETS